VNAQLRVAENISTASLVVSVLDDKGNLLADELVLERREAYRMDRSQLLGSYEQQTSVEQSLNQDLADQILRALSVVMRSSATAAVTAERSIDSDAVRDAP
jgi:outer membrane lipopolysaccharide assembly protein LptE/RlpB